jgi:hypothetical protein
VPSGEVFRASDASLAFDTNHASIIHAAERLGLLRDPSGGALGETDPIDGFIGHDGRFYTYDEMEREIDRRRRQSATARFHQESLIAKVLREIVNPGDQVAWANALLHGADQLGLRAAIRRNDGKVFYDDTGAGDYGGHDKLRAHHGNNAPAEEGWMLDGRFISKGRFFDLEAQHFSKHTPEDAPFRRDCPLCRAGFHQEMREGNDQADRCRPEPRQVPRDARRY